MKAHFKVCFLCYNKEVKINKDVILIVPEQYSFECQRLLLETFGSKISNKIQIHSFTSLCEAICDVYGGVSGVNVDESTRFILIGHAIKNVKDSLKMYGKYASSTSFIKEILSVITEFKQSNISSEALLELASNSDSEMLSRKLHDISLILSAYDAVLSNRFIDPLDLIDRTVNSMNDNSFFTNKTVVIDEFKGFTESQYKLLDRIISASDDTVVSLCCDSLISKSETDIFKSVKNCANRLIRIAESHSVLVAQPLYTEYFDEISYDVSALEAFVAEKLEKPFEDTVNNIEVFQADNVIGEVDHVMQTIRRLVMENGSGFRYNDFVIISRTDCVYSKLIEESSKLYDVPCYTDTRIPLMQLPLSVLVISALKAAVDIDTDELLRVAKTGLVGLSADEISSLENYVYIWGVNGKKWLNDWDMNPDGLREVAEEKFESVQREIEKINSFRAKLIKPIISLRANLNGDVEKMCSAVFHYLDDCNCIDLLRDYANELEITGHLQEAEYQRTGYDVFVRVIDKVIAAVGNNPITAKEFLEILNTSLKFETVGEIPKLKDQVIYGTVDRIRPLRPKVVFVIGVNQDVFPAMISSGGLLSQNDRKVLIDNDLKVSDHSINDCLEEKLLFYFACSYASNKVYISYSKSTATGSALEPSPEIALIKNAFPKLQITKQKKGFHLESAETFESTFRDVAKNFRCNDSTFNSVKSYFGSNSDYKSRIDSLEDYLNCDEPKISGDSALGLYGEKINLSASKVDDFVDCKFLYFCKYGLSARKLDKVEFNPFTRGNIVHYCLEKLIDNHKNDIGQLSNSQISKEILEYSDAYLKENGVDATHFDEKFKFMLDVVNNTAVSLGVALNNEFRVNQFKPFACELKIGEDGVVKGIDIYTDNGHPITLNGYIDRVDVTEDGKVRIVDYKSGSKGDKFSVSEILNGHNLQMLLYLYALLKNGQAVTNASIPAGVLYFPAKQHISDEKSEYVKMNGIVLDDIETIKQMEPQLEGKIVPPKLNAKKTGFTTRNQLASQDTFNVIFKYIEHTLQRIGSSLINGDITRNPIELKSNTTKCNYCDYHSVCRYDLKNEPRKPISFTTSQKAYEAMENELRELEGTYNGD